MKPFHFRLATLLKLRIAVRDERRGRLAEAFHAARVVEDRIAQLQSQQQGLRDRYAAANTPGSVVVEELLDVQRYELVVASERQELAGQLTQLEEEIEHRREAVRLADQEVRVLEKLREKQQRTHRKGVEREESKEFDEIASRQAALQRIDSVMADAPGGER